MLQFMELQRVSPWGRKELDTTSKHAKKRIKSEKELFEIFERKMIQTFLVRMRHIR